VPPKTEGSSRTVPLRDLCLSALTEHAERQADEHDEAGDSRRDNGLVVPTRAAEGNSHSIHPVITLRNSHCLRPRARAADMDGLW